MFNSYLSPISYAFMSFPVAALLFTLPFLIVQYRRHGYIHKLRALMLYLLLLYLLNAFYLIMLPFPSSRHNLPPSGSSIQPVPMQFILEILHSQRFTAFTADQPSAYFALLKEPAVYQAAFNVMLTIPFGMFLGYYFRTRWVVCILLSFTLSLLFEITQITGIYGIFDYPYRVFDVDDLITNTLGGIIGFRIALWISGLLPQIEQLDSQVDLSTRRVAYTRRGIAAMLDTCICLGAAGVLGEIQIPHPIWISFAVYFLLLPCFTSGRTAGKWLVRIRVQGPGSTLPLGRLVIRYGLLYGGLLGINSLLLEPASIIKLAADQLNIVRGAVLLTDFVFLLHLVICMFKKQPLFYEVISRTRNVIIWPERLQQAEVESTANSVEL